jgi:hypothetical protein
MTTVHTVLGWVAYAAPYAYLLAVIVSANLLHTGGRRWQVVMDEFREMDLELSMRNAFRLLAMWLLLGALLAPLIRPDVFQDAPSETDDEAVTS